MSVVFLTQLLPIALIAASGQFSRWELVVIGTEGSLFQDEEITAETG